MCVCAAAWLPLDGNDCSCCTDSGCGPGSGNTAFLFVCMVPSHHGCMQGFPMQANKSGLNHKAAGCIGFNVKQAYSSFQLCLPGIRASNSVLCSPSQKGHLCIKSSSAWLEGFAPCRRRHLYNLRIYCLLQNVLLDIKERFSYATHRPQSIALCTISLIRWYPSFVKQTSKKGCFNCALVVFYQASYLSNQCMTEDPKCHWWYMNPFHRMISI